MSEQPILSNPNLSPEIFRRLLGKLISTPASFNRADATLAIEHLLIPGSVLPSQIGSFLTALHLNGMESNSEVLAGAAEVLRRHSVAVNSPQSEDDRKKTVDIVGTGGDGHNTFNVSTTAAVVAAGAGARVHKHGNRASTSSSGSADLLMALGCPLSPPSTAPSVSQSDPSFRFFMAPHYHPLLGPLAPIRKSLPHRTILNLVGPLVNPARPGGLVLGVAHPRLGETFVQALSKDETVQYAMVVCGEEHLDEISCAGRTRVWEFKRNEDGTVLFKESVISPETFGVDSHLLANVAGGKGPGENAEIFTRLLTQPEESAQSELKPIFDFVLINAAAVLVVAEIAKDVKEGVELARQSINSGAAWKAFQSFKEWDIAVGNLATSSTT
ncbi:anthranilate phosphoribosyltransferase [Serendipita vermifera]|nr:anthranilate phosphoribosyltransferase [Serendipita vermifera]